MASTVVYPFDLATPTGLHLLVRQLVDELIARGEKVTLLLAKPWSLELPLDETAVESYQGRESSLEIRWLPAEIFAPAARHRLSFAFERMAPDVERWMCFGIEASAYVGSLIAHRTDTSCSTFVVAKDVLGRAMMHPDEIAVTLARSRRVFAANPAIVDLLQAFAPREIAALLDEGRLEIARPRCDANGESQARDGDYVCTTGALGLLEDLGELTTRVLAEMRASGAVRWLHVGTVHPRIVGPLASALALRGLAQCFDATGLRGGGDYEQLLQRSRALVKPRGELDTGISIMEADRWGIRVSLPAGCPFAADGAARFAAAERRLREIDGRALAASLLDR